VGFNLGIPCAKIPPRPSGDGEPPPKPPPFRLPPPLLPGPEVAGAAGLGLSKGERDTISETTIE